MQIDFFALGRMSIDLFSQDVGAAWEDITGFHAFVGGTPLNIAVGVQRLGLQSAMLTGASNDGTGRLVRKFLEQEGVLTDYLFYKPQGSTNAFMLSVEPPHKFEPTVYQTNSPDLFLTVDDVQQAPVSQARAILFTGIGLIAKSGMTASLLAAEQCKAGGGTVFVDVDYKTAHWRNADEFGVILRASLRNVDVVMGTEKEICAAAGIDDPQQAAEHLLTLVHEAVIIKRGERGAHLLTKNGTQLDAPLFPVKVLNVFGAGDAFAAGIIYGRLQGMDWAASLRLASACGALIVTRHGCANDMPTLAEIQMFIEKQ